MTYIRYYKSTSANSEYIDQPIENNITPIIADQIFSSTIGAISYWYTANNVQYLPGEEYTGSSDLILYAHWDIANAGSLVWKDVPCTIGGVTSNYDIDISDLYSEVECVYGKNQPFSYITFKIRKVDFLSDEYWNTRISEGFGPKPDNLSFTQDITRFETDVFSIKGEWVYKRLDDDSNTYYTVTCFHPAEKIKSNTLTNLLHFTISGSSVTILNQTVSLTQVPGQTVKYYATTSNPNSTIYFDISDVNNPYIEYITARPIEMVKLIFIGSGLTTYASMIDSNNPSCKIDGGYTYVNLSSVTLDDLPDSYTQSQLEALKSGTKYNIPNNYTISIRPDTNCWNLLESIGKFVNCTPFFYDKLYFVDYRVPDQSISQMELDYGMPTTQEQGVTYPDILNISANEDQGSDYILSSQKVTSEAYSTTTVISDAITSNDGEVIKYMAIEKVALDNNDFVFDTTSRNIQCKIIALNELIKWYKPSDCVKYDISELNEVRTYSTLPISGTVGDVICVSVPNEWLDAYYRWNGSVWVQISDIVRNVERVGGIAPYSKVGTLTDKQNGLTLSNVPLAYTYVSYPTCVTTYVWGEPKFMDSEGQISNISEVAKDATLSNTSDVQISDNYNAKIVIGNQSLSELQDDRTGFTGLILEKNWNAELYRLVGYYNGAVQAEFNTQGKISAGGGAIILDENGMTARDTNNNVVATIDRTGSYNTGFLNGVSHVCLNNNGLTHVIPNQRSTYLDQAGINFIAEADPTHKIFQINTKYGQYLGSESSDNIYAVDLYATPDQQGGIKSVLRLLKKPWTSGVQVTTGLFDSSYVTTQAYYTSCSTSYVTGYATSTAGTQYINLSGDSTNYTSMETLFETKNTSTFGVETYGPYGTDPNNPCISAIDIDIVSSMNAPCYVLKNATSATWSVNVNSDSSQLTSVKIGYKSSYGGSFTYTSSISLSPQHSATLQITLPSECYGLRIHIEGYLPGNFIVVPQPKISSNIYFTTASSGSEVRLFDDHLSLCGKTTFLGNLTGDFTVDTTFKNSMVNSGFAIISGAPFYSESYTGNSGYVDIPIENENNKLRINWKTIYMADADTSATINWIAPFKDANYAVWVNLNITTGQNYNNPYCGPLWTRCDGSYQSASKTTVCNDAWNGYICALAIGRAPNNA